MLIFYFKVELRHNLLRRVLLLLDDVFDDNRLDLGMHSLIAALHIFEFKFIYLYYTILNHILSH